MKRLSATALLAALVAGLTFSLPSCKGNSKDDKETKDSNPAAGPSGGSVAPSPAPTPPSPPPVAGPTPGSIPTTPPIAIPTTPPTTPPSGPATPGDQPAGPSQPQNAPTPGEGAGGAPAPDDGKPTFDPNAGQVRVAGLSPPTPIDKMLGLDIVFRQAGTTIDWGNVWSKYQLDVNPNDFSDTKISLPILVGMRMSDGVLAIKARDAEKLNGVASDIEKLAKKLNVSDGELARAKKIRLYAGRNEWPRVFLELGYLQNDVLRTLKKDGNVDRKALLIAAGWVQGLNAISGVVLDKYSPTASGLLREPLLVRAILADLNALRPDKKNSPQAQVLISELNKILPLLDIPMRGTMPKEDVQKIADLSSACCRKLRDLAK